MLDAIKKMRESYIANVGYPPPFVNITRDQHDELKSDLCKQDEQYCDPSMVNKIMDIELKLKTCTFT